MASRPVDMTKMLNCHTPLTAAPDRYAGIKGDSTYLSRLPHEEGGGEAVRAKQARDAEAISPAANLLIREALSPVKVATPTTDAVLGPKPAAPKRARSAHKKARPAQAKVQAAPTNPDRDARRNADNQAFLSGLLPSVPSDPNEQVKLVKAAQTLFEQNHCYATAAGNVDGWAGKNTAAARSKFDGSAVAAGVKAEDLAKFHAFCLSATLGDSSVKALAAAYLAATAGPVNPAQETTEPPKQSLKVAAWVSKDSAELKAFVEGPLAAAAKSETDLNGLIARATAEFAPLSRSDRGAIVTNLTGLIVTADKPIKAVLMTLVTALKGVAANPESVPGAPGTSDVRV